MVSKSIPHSVHEAVVHDFKTTVQGDVLQSEDSGYDATRAVWNAMIDRRPAMIARCTDVDDVIASVTFAREQNLEISIRGGGHGVSGKAVCEGGLMIDLSPMKSISIDPVARTARAEPGVLWEEFDAATHAHGLATTGGTVGTTGIAGLTLGGGQGWLAGKYGLTLDNLLSADVVTADGRLLKASATENDDLFWGLRGAGANFGVVTSFEYRLHPVDQVLGGLVIHPLDSARAALRYYREFTATEPDELTTYVGILTLPDGTTVIAFVACYAGDLAEGERVLAPLRSFGSPVADTIAQMAYPDMQAIIGAGYPYGRQNYWKSGLANEISDEAIETIVEYAGQMPSPYAAIVIADCHGAFGRVGKTDTAYFHRDMQYDVLMLANWVDPADSGPNIQWTRDLHQAVRPYLSQGVYVNDLGDDAGEQGVHSAYGGNYPRLADLKTKYDPTNVFHLNQNIKPVVRVNG